MIFRRDVIVTFRHHDVRQRRVQIDLCDEVIHPLLEIQGAVRHQFLDLWTVTSAVELVFTKRIALEAR